MAGEHQYQGPLDRSIGASVRGNSTAFGFSITITVSFGVLTTLSGSPDIGELLMFGVAAATAVALLEALVTRGFRKKTESVPQHVDMLGTAMNMASVAGGAGAATGVGEAISGSLVWPVGAFAAATVFVLLESLEIFAAQKVLGDPGPEKE